MKKLVVVFMAMFAVAFVSCNGNASKVDGTVNDSDSVVLNDTVIGDTLVQDTVAE